jgi:16S rRNA (adenine1518-N6/adenine1519-N6)-dimethyltransferase
VKARKRFGQHFLERAWADRLLLASGLGADDHVLEIGPGRGVLTEWLSAHVASLTAVEIDRDLAALLRLRLPGSVRLIEADFLDLAPATLLPDDGPARLRVIGNLPYNVSSPILFRLLELSRATGRLTDATLMLQREVAERIASAPGSKSYGVLSVMVQLDADVEPLLTLPPGAFRPAPQVWSSVIRLTFRPPGVAVADRRRFDTLVRALFAQRRKTLLNGVRPLAASTGHDAAAVLRSAGLDPTRRAETLHLAELAGLADALTAAPPPSSVV